MFKYSKRTCSSDSRVYKTTILIHWNSIILQYLSTFLLSVGLLTLMYIDSLVVLDKPWSCLPIMLKFSGVVLCSIWVQCTFNTPDLKINNDNWYAHRTSLSGCALSIPTKRHLHRTIWHNGCPLNLEHVHRIS